MTWPPTVSDLVSAQAAATPDAVAVTGLTYRELDEAADALARRLAGQGARGRVVAVRMAAPADRAVALLGVLKAGGAYLLLGPADPLPAGVDPVLVLTDLDIAGDGEPATASADDPACVLHRGTQSLTLTHRELLDLVARLMVGGAELFAGSAFEVWAALTEGLEVGAAPIRPVAAVDAASPVLPLDHDRPAGPAQPGEPIDLVLPTDTVHALNISGTAPFVVLLAAFQVLLAKYAGQAVVGVDVPAGLARTDLSGDPSVAELVEQVRTVLLALPPAGSRVAMTWADAPSTGHDLAIRWDDELRGVVEYDRNIFDADTIHRLADHFVLLLEGMLRNRGARLSELSMMTPADRVAMIEASTAFRGRTRSDSTVPGLVGEWARRTPDAVAVASGPVRLTYAEFDDRANRLGRMLRERGVRTGDVVGVCLERSVDLLVVLYAVLKAGAAYLPLDPSYPAARLRFMVDDARPRLVVANRKHWADDWLVIGDLDLTAPSEPLINEVLPDSLAYVMYTSGSTGQPKAVAVAHRGIARLATDETVCRLHGEVMLQAGAFAFDASTLEIWGPLANGGSVAVFPAGRDPVNDLRDFIAAEGVTSCVFATALFHEIVNTRPADLRGLRQIVIGGDVLAVPVVRRALAALPDTRIINVYGPTEITTFCTAHEIDRKTPLPRTIPIGRPVADATVYVLDDNLAMVPIGVPGELYVGGAGLAHGYLGRPGLTAARFVPNPFGDGDRLYRTGDRARFRPDGTLEFLGRLDGQIKLRGFRVETGEIESVLRGHPDVRDAVVTVVGDDAVSRQLVALAEAPAGTDLRGYLAERLPPHQVPARVAVTDRLPRTPVGKIDRAAITLPDEAPAESPGDPVTARIVEIWREVLDTDTVGPRHNFFEAGGNSLLLTRVRARILARFGRDVPLVDLFRYPTVPLLADYLRGAEVSTRDTAVAGAVRAGRDRMARLRARRDARPTPRS